MIYVGLANILFLLRIALVRYGVLRNQIYFVIIFSLFVFSAFRYQVGCDWFGYHYYWLHTSIDDVSRFSFTSEPIFSSVLIFIRYMDWPYPVINVISSAIFFLGVNVLARRQPDRLAFLVLLFPILIINMPMSGIRQGASIGIICVALSNFIDRRPMRFIFWLIIATGFHISAILFMLLIPFATGRFSFQRIVLGMFLALPGLILLVYSVALEKLIFRYVGNSETTDAAGALFRVGMQTLTALYFLIFLRKKWLRIYPQDYNLVLIGVIGMSLLIFIIPISGVVADRIAYYFIPIQTIIFARIPFLPFERSRALHSTLPYLGLLVVFITWSLLSNIFSQCYIPYQSWIFGFPGGDSNGI
jgi:hypothetical protein